MKGRVIIIALFIVLILSNYFILGESSVFAASKNETSKITNTTNKKTLSVKSKPKKNDKVIKKAEVLKKETESQMKDVISTKTQKKNKLPKQAKKQSDKVLNKVSEVLRVKQEVAQPNKEMEIRDTTVSNLPVVISVPPNTILCNGKIWALCQNGQNFNCPASGDAICLLQNNFKQENSQNKIDNYEIEQKRNEDKQKELSKKANLEREQETIRQEEQRKQKELEEEKKVYQQKVRDFEQLLIQIDLYTKEKNKLEQESLVQENLYISTYCANKEKELIGNYASRGLYRSGIRQKAVEDLRITCPIEARNLYRASQNDSLYPFILKLEESKKMFQQYNRDLYSSCITYKLGNCSIYVDAGYPIK